MEEAKKSQNKFEEMKHLRTTRLRHLVGTGEASGECRYHLSSTKATVLVRQIRSQGLSFQLWPAASSLVTILDRCPSALLPPTNSFSPIHIIELGSGTAYWPRWHRCRIHSRRPRYPDRPPPCPPQPALQRGRQLRRRRRPRRFHRRAPASVGGGRGRGGIPRRRDADVVYYDHLIDPLLRTLRALVKGEAVFVMAHRLNVTVREQWMMIR